MATPRVQPPAQGDPNEQDSRFTRPSNWVEIQALQSALAPTVHDYYSFIGNEPLPTNLWDNYVDQWVSLQQQMEGEWAIKHRGALPVLLWRKRWTGGIQNWHTARTSDPQNGLRDVQIDQVYTLDTNARGGTTTWEQERVRRLGALAGDLALERQQHDRLLVDGGATQIVNAATDEEPPSPVPQASGYIDWTAWIVNDGEEDGTEGF